LGRARSVPNSEVFSFHRAINNENSSLGPDEVSLFHRMSLFRRVYIHRFHCTAASLQVPGLTEPWFVFRVAYTQVHCLITLVLASSSASHHWVFQSHRKDFIYILFQGLTAGTREMLKSDRVLSLVWRDVSITQLALVYASS
jgi:hypothetical protein